MYIGSHASNSQPHPKLSFTLYNVCALWMHAVLHYIVKNALQCMLLFFPNICNSYALHCPFIVRLYIHFKVFFFFTIKIHYIEAEHAAQNFFFGNTHQRSALMWTEAIGHKANCFVLALELHWATLPYTAGVNVPFPPLTSSAFPFLWCLWLCFVSGEGGGLFGGPF